MSELNSFERRRAVRVLTAISIEIRDHRGFTLQSTRDLSTGGVFFDRAIPHGVGTRVELAFTLPGEQRAIRCEGEVVNVPNTKGYGMGIRFLSLSPNDQQRLNDFTQKLFDEGYGAP